MNLPNRITMARIFLSILIIAILLFPFDAVGITTLKLFINESIVVDVKYLIVGGLFIVASITDFVDGYIARKYSMVTDLGKMLDAIADKVLVNSVLIILAAAGYINVVIPVIIVLRDIVVNAIKMEAAGKGKVVAAIGSGKLKTAALMTGTTLVFFYNMPFEYGNINVADVLLYFACVMSLISAFQYYHQNKELIFPSKKN